MYISINFTGNILSWQYFKEIKQSLFVFVLTARTLIVSFVLDIIPSLCLAVLADLELFPRSLVSETSQVL